MKQAFASSFSERSELPQGNGNGQPYIGSADKAIESGWTDLAVPPGITPQLLKSICKMRVERGELVPTKLLSANAWDMLLQLYLAHVEQHRVTVGRLTSRAKLPPTTALRWLSQLHSEGLISKTEDGLDARRVYVCLSHTGVLAMNRYFARTASGSIFI